MVTNSQRKSLIFQLIRAARGQPPLSPSSSVGVDTSTSPTALLALQTHVPSSTPLQLSLQRCPPPLPCFPLQQHHFGQLAGTGVNGSSNAATGSSYGSVASPSDFHSYLCNKIRQAQERVILASLYIGVGSKKVGNFEVLDAAGKVNDHCKEDEFLQALQDAASNKKIKKIQVLLDANRAMRKVFLTDKHHSKQSTRSDTNSGPVSTNSAEAVFSRISPFFSGQDDSSNFENSGLFLFPVCDKRWSTIIPSPLDEVVGVFHIKVLFPLIIEK